MTLLELILRFINGDLIHFFLGGLFAVLGWQLGRGLTRFILGDKRFVWLLLATACAVCGICAAHAGYEAFWTVWNTPLAEPLHIIR